MNKITQKHHKSNSKDESEIYEKFLQTYETEDGLRDATGQSFLQSKDD